MKSIKFLSFSMAVCMICLLTMTSCSAAEVPAASGGAGMDSAKLTSKTQPASTFSDVPAGAWYAEAIDYCQQHGIMSGTTATTFAPEATLTRAMLATVLHRMSRTPAVSAVAGSWYSDAVSWAAKNSIISGYGGGTFGVDDPTTREQAVTILWRFAGEPESAAAADISDAASVSSWAQTAVRWANANGILEGITSNRRFDPKTNIKRGEIASMLYHYLSNIASSQPGPAAGGKTLAAYFSATNTTRPLAEYAADILNADLAEIVPEVPYTDADLAYYTNGRVDREQSDPSARPAISGSVENMADYDVIFLGYPIWHGQPPRIISTFLESYDLTGKTIVPFCTSHSSGYSDSSIKSLAPGANWITGRRFAGGTSRSTVEEWINGLELPQPAVDAAISAASKAGFNFEAKSVTLNSGYEMPINGLGTYSLHGETCVNSVKSALASGVRLIDTASAYGNEEEVGQAIREAIDEGIIKREDVFVITKIYPGSEMANPEQSIQACLDRLDIGYVDMMLLHHPDRNDVKAYQAMEKFVEDGKIRSLGLSNWYVKELESFLPQVTITPALVQNEIHPYYQENDVIPYIQDLGIVVQGWYPLGGRGHTAELLGDEVISGIAKAHGVSSAQVILRWNLQKGVVVIPGSSNPDHIKENTELYGFELTDAEMARINALDRSEKHDWY
ncbi:aldo/keto reductase [uncultured Oscillibacter sp.]|uniref:aldo/keto reductase n=1 Tax=uncultured Oscillibacter sp. TaxID=876091 RepID=UPI0025D74467|nr:aldo/keto reductase [uncultured Oscillibacter sp.]